MKITIVVDNRVAQTGLTAVHGFAAWLESKGAPILFDSGKGNALSENTALLGLDVQRLQTAVLSHGHHDHAEGLPWLMAVNPKIQLDRTVKAFMPKWSLDPGAVWRYAGIPYALHELPAKRFVIHDSPRQVESGIWSTGALWPAAFAYGSVLDKRLHVNGGGQCVPDGFEDEQAMVFELQEGLGVLVGCCHRGIPALLDAVHCLFPGRPVKALAGGFHMAGLGPKVWDSVLDRLRAEGVQQMISLHCSGDDWMDYVETHLPGVAVRGHAGFVWEWSLA